MIQAKDVMNTSIVTVKAESTVTDIANVLLENHISAVPVVDDYNRLLGIVSEGDLMRRAESDTERTPSWWLSMFGATDAVVKKFVKTHGTHAAEVMTRSVVTVTTDTPVKKIAQLLEEKRIKRVPVVDGDRLLGIVSRADLLRGFVAFGHKQEPVSEDDHSIRDKIAADLRKNNLAFPNANIVVSDGIVHLWGAVATDEERDALRIAAEGVAGVQAVEDHLGRVPPGSSWA